MRVGLAVVLISTAVLQLPGVAASEERAGTRWRFSGSEDYSRKDKLDQRVSLRASGRATLRGSSCCDIWEVAFPTESTFELREDEEVVAMGTVISQGSTDELLVDAASLPSLLAWLGDEMERWWNSPVVDVNLVFDPRALTAHGVSIKYRRGSVVLRMSFRFTGTVIAVDALRGFGPGPAVGRMTFVEKRTWVGPITDE